MHAPRFARRALALPLFSLGLIGLAAAPLHAQDESADAEPQWAFEESDIPVDPEYTFGVLENGMRYILRENKTPEGQALVRMRIGSGSLEETESELGLSHFLEHMAFNGSTNIPEGEMVKLLERKGLAFGADTNASTGFEAITYMLNLPRNDADLLDTSLMLMRETASEITIAEDAVDRERGVILAERRDRRNFAYKSLEDNLEFSSPGARYITRLPIGTLPVLENATAADMRALYERTYVPENTVLAIVGDYPVEVLEAAVKKHFASWSGPEAPPEPVTGPLDITRKGETDIYTDPALSERVRVWRYHPWQDRKDTIAERQQGLERQVGYNIINRRLAALARGADAPFRSAGFGVGDVFEDGRQTSLVISSADGEWRKGLEAAALELRTALEFGFSQSEVNEQIARLRSSIEASARGADTRTHGALIGGALGLVANDRVPSTPQSALERFEAYANEITPESALAAVKRDSTALVEPLIRFEGRTAPTGGANGLRSAWRAAMAAPISAPDFSETAEFAYSDFGPAGEIVSDTIDERLGLRLIRFANGVRLNLKQTDIREDQVRYRLQLDGGQLLNTREDPLKTALVGSMPAGGLGEHSQDELTTILAGKRVGYSIGSGADVFVMNGSTAPKDLDLQMQLLAASLTDPGYRSEGEERYGRSIDNFFANLDATPGRALGNALGGILSSNDPRFSLQSKQAYRERSFAKLRSDIGDRLAKGAIEIALVGDIDEDAAIAAVASTLGALPQREAEFRQREAARIRSFTALRGQRVLAHTGEADQALIRMTWPTRDDSDLKEALQLGLLARVVRLKLTDQLREDLGQAYSPSASSSTSRIYKDYGTFNIAASVDLEQVEPTRAAIAAMLAGLRDEPLDEDTLSRARKPLLESYDNALKSLGGWMGLADRAQSEKARLQRFFDAPDIIKSFTGEDMQQAAIGFLYPDEAVEFVVVPQGSDAAKGAMRVRAQ
jgi:zinc protease